MSLIALWMLCSCLSPEAVSRRSPSGGRPPISPTPLQPEQPGQPEQPAPEADRADEDAILIPEKNHPILRERQLLVNGQPFAIRAVCWNPVRPGENHPQGLIFRNPAAKDIEQIERDFQMMKDMGVNTIRTYEAILDDRVLALVRKYQLHMIVPVFNYYATPMSDVVALVQKLKDHPGTLFWEIGNEWNYNQFYSAGSSSPLTMDASKALIKQVLSTVRTVDSRLPIATVYGELPSRELIDELNGIDIWGLNIYSGLSFGTRFQTWSTLTDKPMYLAEYGADAINKTLLDEGSQAKAVIALTQEIEQNVKARSGSQVSLGGAVFEWNDEWWKDGKGTADKQDIGGIAPGSGPYPDMIFNEEWWGLVTIDRKPRAAYNELRKLWNPLAVETF